MAGGILYNVPPIAAELQQQGLIERAFHDSMFPAMQFLGEAIVEEWPANTGQEILMTRRGLMPVNVTPLTPGVDPTPVQVPYEQWIAVLNEYGSPVDTHIPTSATSTADEFLSNIHTLGLNSAQTMNRVARNTLFKAYIGGQTVLIAAAASTDTQIHVAACNGFSAVINIGKNVRPVPPSASTPLTITIGSGAAKITRKVIGVAPDDPNDPYGPGFLILSTSIGGAGFAIRTAVKSSIAPRIVRSAGGDSIDAIGENDTMTLQQIINAVAFLRRANVQPHAASGYFHAHLNPLANAQIYADPVFQRLNQSLPDGYAYKEGFIGETSGVAFFMNNEMPDTTNVGTLVPTGEDAFYAPEIGGEIVNGNGVGINRVIITGRGSYYEKWLDERAYVTEAGVNGKIGEFQIVNNGIEVSTERRRLILRAPMNRKQDIVSAMWTTSTSYSVPTDITANSGPEMYKRAIVLEFAA